jgi:anaerobic selenocysteine-containing dehydrogenase
MANSVQRDTRTLNSLTARIDSPYTSDQKRWHVVESTWDEALTLVASKFKATQETDGPNSVAFLSFARVTNEENYLMNKLARAGFHTNYLDHCARLCHGPTVSGLARSFGSVAMTNSIADIAESDFIFVIGSNTMEQQRQRGKIKLRLYPRLRALRFRGKGSASSYGHTENQRTNNKKTNNASPCLMKGPLRATLEAKSLITLSSF